MKTNPILACLLLLPLLAAAQEKPASTPYQPGKWYAGLRHEAYDFNASNNAVFTDNASRLGFTFTGGYRLSPHFELQAGLMPTRVAGRVAGVGGSRGSYMIDPRSIEVLNDTTQRSVVTYYSGWGLYAPVSVKYIPFGAQRRYQPYLVAGIGTLISGTSRYTTLFDPRFDLAPDGEIRFRIYESQQEPTGTKALFAAQAGMGLNVRLYKRLHLSSELLFTRNLRRNGAFGWGSSIGLLYDFAPKTAN